jgi:hypothetical protein
MNETSVGTVYIYIYSAQRDLVVYRLIVSKTEVLVSKMELYGFSLLFVT